MLDAGTSDADAVHFLKSIATNKPALYLSGYDNHRNGVHECGGNAGNRIGCTGARCDQHHTRFTRRTRVPVSGMRGRLFMADKNMFDRILLVQRIINMQNGPTGIPEQKFDTFLLECLD